MTKKISSYVDYLGCKLTAYSPMLGIILIIEIHFLLYLYFIEDKILTNKIISAVLQVFLFFSLIYELTQRFKILNGKNFYETYKEATEFHIEKKCTELEMTNKIFNETALTIQYTIGQPDIEKKVRNLSNKIQELETKSEKYQLSSEKKNKELAQTLKNVKNRIDNLQQNISHTFTGNIKLTTFNTLLILYNIVITFFI